jgi:hypothetical protein
LSFVGCKDCGAAANDERVWNTRADPALAAAQAEVARLREALAEIKASPHSNIANNGYQSPRQIATQALGE